jgi:hypothetical protein
MGHRRVNPGFGFGEVEFSGVIDDLTEQNPDRLAILSDHLQLLPKSISGRIKRVRILCASTPQKTFFGTSNGSELGFEVSPKIRKAQFQPCRRGVSLPRTIGHIRFISQISLRLISGAGLEILQG